jgi:hypothetical protein
VLMFQFNLTTYIITAEIVMFFFLSGIAIFILLDMGVTNIGGQKRLVHLFMRNPWKIEALIICLFSSLPIFIIYIIMMREDPSLLSLLGSIVLAWPLIMYECHRKMMDFHQLLRIGKKKEHDPVFMAKLSITGWTIAACGMVLSFMLGVFSISLELSCFLMGLCGMAVIFTPFRKSLQLYETKLRQQIMNRSKIIHLQSAFIF